MSQVAKKATTTKKMKHDSKHVITAYRCPQKDELELSAKIHYLNEVYNKDPLHTA